MSEVTNRDWNLMLMLLAVSERPKETDDGVPSLRWCANEMNHRYMHDVFPTDRTRVKDPTQERWLPMDRKEFQAYPFCSIQSIKSIQFHPWKTNVQFSLREVYIHSLHTSVQTRECVWVRCTNYPYNPPWHDVLPMTGPGPIHCPWSLVTSYLNKLILNTS